MVFVTVKSEFFNEFLDYLDVNIVNYISFDLKEIGKVISFRISLNYDLSERNRKKNEIPRLDIRKQTFKNNFVKQYVFNIY